MQMSEFAKLEKEWKAKGSPPCDHPTVDREYYLGSGTGDEGCTVCGEVWPRGERDQHRPPPGN